MPLKVWPLNNIALRQFDINYILGMQCLFRRSFNFLSGHLIFDQDICYYIVIFDPDI
jgi:hypothetical protein